MQAGSSPGERFREYFEVVPAIDDHTRDAVFQIRHEVFCEDLLFEPIRADRRETDAFDAHSVHLLMRRNDETREMVGCLRLVLAQVEGKDFELPFERSCAQSIDRSIVDPATLDRQRIAEVSRLAVRGRYRRRKGEAKQSISLSAEDFGTPEQPRFPHIPVGLYLGSFALAKRHGIETQFMLTEPRMAEHFGRIGFRIHTIGEPIEHRGLRVPSMLNVRETVKHLRRSIRPIWETINEQMDQYLAAQRDLRRRVEPVQGAA